MKRAALFIVCVLSVECVVWHAGSQGNYFSIYAGCAADVIFYMVAEKAVNFEAEHGVRSNVDVYWGDAWDADFDHGRNRRRCGCLFNRGTTWNPQFAAMVD